MSEWLNILIAFGSGSVVSTVAQYFFNERTKRRTILFQEKKEAFVGLLSAYHQAAVDRSDKNALEFAYWQIRCELICSDKTKAAIRRVVATNDDRTGRAVAHEELKDCLSGEIKALL
jgi:hypothetical protein